MPYTQGKASPTQVSRNSMYHRKKRVPRGPVSRGQVDETSGKIYVNHLGWTLDSLKVTEEEDRDSWTPGKQEDRDAVRNSDSSETQTRLTENQVTHVLWAPEKRSRELTVTGSHKGQ